MFSGNDYPKCISTSPLLNMVELFYRGVEIIYTLPAVHVFLLVHSLKTTW